MRYQPAVSRVERASAARERRCGDGGPVLSCPDKHRLEHTPHCWQLAGDWLAACRRLRDAARYQPAVSRVERASAARDERRCGDGGPVLSCPDKHQLEHTPHGAAGSAHTIGARFERLLPRGPRPI